MARTTTGSVRHADIGRVGGSNGWHQLHTELCGLVQVVGIDHNGHAADNDNANSFSGECVRGVCADRMNQQTGRAGMRMASDVLGRHVFR